jgi:hypothetical protein
VTGLASGREARAGMIRIGGRREVRLVARVAGSRSPPAIASNQMALLTRGGKVRPRQSQGGGRMIKGRRLPRGRRVTSLTIVRKERGNVIRTGGRVEIRLVTGETLSGSAGVLAIDVTLDTAQIDMRPGEREAGGGMIKRRVPVGHGMASLAGGGEACRHMIRITGTGEIRLMTGIASSGRAARVVAVGVALLTVDRQVRASQGEDRGSMIEGGRLPS